MLIKTELGYTHNRDIYSNVIEIAVATPLLNGQEPGPLRGGAPIAMDFPAL